MRYFNIENNRLTYNKIAPLYAREFGSMIPDQMFFSEFLTALNGAMLLDVGCGVGQYCLYAASKGFVALGIDNSEKMISIAKNVADECQFELQNAMDIGYHNTFNGIIVNNLLCNLTTEQSLTVLSRCYDALKDDGLMYVSITDGEGEGFEPEPLAPDLRLYMKRYKLSEFKALVEELFELVKVWTIDFVDPGNPGERKNYFLLRKKLRDV